MSVSLKRKIETQDRNAQRTEGPADYRYLVELLDTVRDNTLISESLHGLPGLDKRSRSEKLRDLRQLGAIEFCGTIDPAEAKTWLKRIKVCEVLDPRFCDLSIS